MSVEEQNKKKKLRSDEIFSKINQFVTLQKDETANYNKIFTKVTDKIISILKQEDEVFRKYYQRPMYTGSFYKLTKVGKPEEFDLNLIFAIPDLDNAEIKKGRPGFAKIRFDKKKLSPVWVENKVLNKWLDSEYYLDNDKIRRWFEGVVEKSMSAFKNGNNKIILPIDSGSNYEVKVRKSGPAFTLCVTYESMKFSVDLVPVLEFSRAPPLPGIQQSKYSWNLVPKPLKDGENPHQNWRYSFYSHEQDMLKKFGKVKPVIRHIKKLRDTQNWSILVSYHIETIFFHALSENKIDDNTPQTVLLVFMLKELSKAFKSRKLNYFWDKTFNLFGELTEEKIISVQKRLDKIIKEIEAEPSTMTQYFLIKEEQDKINGEMANDSTACLSRPLPLSSDSKSKLQNKSAIKNEVKTLNNKIPLLEASFKNLFIQRDIDQTDASTTYNTEIKALLSSLINEMKQLKSNVRKIEIKIDQVNENIKKINSRSTFFDME
ncbi:cyclic GMP-AMP synthase isoform X2 [Cotesia glomerata]|uniref:cyclic GMP-AMP synthase isoform X2 n=1 Tax=Cotesia glomerata TaxID=32391 RepID=UPI001D0113E2|nr:cyclic GMP-AMP synthase isoform X2 [Cotesia glomerata]